uniref:potassium channel subfamily K member 1-like n=1 Tax=Doryrhamphus excisus TaxID=161450 RepID=UPI0025AE50A8|nr:potassium channel subfamily K member 1-like [Doryrhamphus excisus]
MEVCLASRHRSALNFAVMVLVYAAYLLVGAGVFSAIELPYEIRLRDELEASHRDFLGNNTCVSEARLRELLVRVLEANNYGVSVMSGRGHRNWDFMSSLFFTSTVLTTTGYGHTVPLSDEGKAFCIIYSLVGIPATLFFLSAVVQRIMVPVTRRPLSYFPRRWAMSKSKFAVVHAAILAVVVTLLLLIIPSWIFFTLEKDWNFLESLYFCFISLTTIGLGDYVPGETHSTEENPYQQFYKLLITVYLLLGLVCVLVLMETCVELPQMRRLRQRFYLEGIRELDAETANIIEREHAAAADPPISYHSAGIPSVSEQAASMRASYTPASGSSSLHSKLGRACKSEEAL